MKAFSLIALSALAAFAIAGCKHEPGALPTAATADAGYPDHIRAILVDRCATAGCHNDASSINAKGLNLSTWAKLFEGSSAGAAIVPYNLPNSSLLHFVNLDSSLGPVARPAMPYNSQNPDEPINPLTRDEYIALRDWIAAGAPNKNGQAPFFSNADSRQKIYCTMQGCDLIGVLDAETGLVMRYIQVGIVDNVPESPHCVRVSADGRYAYVSFLGSDLVQKIDTREDKVIGQTNLGTVATGDWNVLTVSEDGERIAVTNWKNDGDVVIIRTSDMSILAHYGGPDLFEYPHGIAAVPTFDTFYVTAEYGNVIYKFSPNGAYFKKIRIDGGPETFLPLTRDPHEIIFSPDRSKYFLSCQASNEVRVMDAKTDALIASINVGIRPREMDVSRTFPYLFVTCEEDVAPAPMKGSVYCINYNTLQVERVMQDGRFAQPHGISVDDQKGLVYVASRNASSTGPAPHHASACAGRNGWYTIYDLNTLMPANGKRFEVSVEPYSMDARFKGAR